jgi:hypothetical protein
MSDEDWVMPIYVARDVTFGEVTPRRGEETLGHGGYGGVRPTGLRAGQGGIGHTYRAARQIEGVMGVCG